MKPRFDELAHVADGERIAIRGRYERFRPWPPPPGPPACARVVLVGGAVMIGRYMAPESLRPNDELSRLDGAVVIVTGRYHRTRAWPHPDPMPGIWTGGGPQLVDVESVEMVTPCPPQTEQPVSPERTASSAQTPQLPFPHATPQPRGAEPARAATLPCPGWLARRALAEGTFRPIAALTLVTSLAAAVATFLVPGELLDPPRDVGAWAPLVTGASTALGLYFGQVWLISARELRRLTMLPWSFDLGAYVALLDGERTTARLCVEVELTAPVDARDRDRLLSPKTINGAELRWSGDRALSILCPTVSTWKVAHSRAPGGHDNADVHRWFRRCLRRAIMPLHESRRVSRTVTRLL